MNKGKLDVVKQEMTRVNIYYCEQESLRRNGIALIVNKSPKQYLGAVSKMTE